MDLATATHVGIRPWNEGDLPLLERLMGTAEMTAHLGGPESPEQIGKRHRRYVASGESASASMFVIVVGDDQTPAGSVGYWEQQDGDDTVWETGWSVLSEFQGKGIATRATKIVIERARAEGKHRFIHALPSVDNAPSNAVCRKLGFDLIGEIDFEYPPGNAMRGNDWRLDLFGRNE